MLKSDAEELVLRYLSPIYGFVLKRCSNLQDAEDLTQEIILKVYSALLTKDDIADPGKYIWTAAHNALNNHYRKGQNSGCGAPFEDCQDQFFTNDETLDRLCHDETVDRLHQEIAYLSTLQRKIIIAYFYENKKQTEIAAEWNLPLGTVKWHLFEAKKDLKKGMETMHPSSHLKFNPIRFSLCGTSGSVGTKGSNENFFRSSLSQNIAYALWNGPKTVTEIADDLGVSPVYIESEVNYLEEYGFLKKQGQKYLVNILIDVPTQEKNNLQSTMYQEASHIFANELMDKLLASGLLDSRHIVCARKADQNFLLWTLIPFIAALSEDSAAKHEITFEQAATLRPDGGKNICYVTIENDVTPPLYWDDMLTWCGPMWNSRDDYMLWQIESPWSKRFVDDNYHEKAMGELGLLTRLDEPRSKEEYANLIQRGYFAPGTTDFSKENLQVLWIEDKDTLDALLNLGTEIKAAHREQFDALKAPYIQSVLADTPKHLHTMRQYGLQHLFHSDGWFILHCIHTLLENGRLKPPTEEQRNSLTTLICKGNLF